MTLAVRILSEESWLRDIWDISWDISGYLRISHEISQISHSKGFKENESENEEC